MALTQSAPTSFDTSGAAGVKSTSHTTGASEKYVVVAIYDPRDRDATVASAVTIDGVALTRITHADESFGGSYFAAELWALLSGVPTGGSYTVEVTMANATTGTRATVYSGGCGGIPVLGDSDQHEAAPNGSHAYSMDSGAVHGLMFGVFCGTSGFASIGASVGDLVVTDTASTNGMCMVQAASTTGVRGWSYGLTTVVASGSLMLTETEPVVAPDAFGVEVGFTAGATIGSSGPQYILGARIRPLEVGFQTGLRMGGTRKRQVALVGPDDAPRLFTPEMTVDGNEGDRLTQHADRPPTWEPTTHYEPVRFDTDGDGVADDWLYHSDGDVVMLEVLD